MTDSSTSCFIESLEKGYYEFCDLHRKKHGLSPIDSTGCVSECPAKDTCLVVNYGKKDNDTSNNLTYLL